LNNIEFAVLLLQLDADKTNNAVAPCFVEMFLADSMVEVSYSKQATAKFAHLCSLNSLTWLIFQIIAC